MSAGRSPKASFVLSTTTSNAPSRGWFSCTTDRSNWIFEKFTISTPTPELFTTLPSIVSVKSACWGVAFATAEVKYAMGPRIFLPAAAPFMMVAS